MRVEIEDAAFRRAQSLIDKGSQRVQERMTKFEEDLKFFKTSVELTPAQEAQLRQQAYQEAMTATGSPAPDGGQAPTPPGQPAGQPPADPIEQTVAAIWQKHGQTVEDNDPEVAQYKLNEIQNLYAWFQAVDQAAAAKAIRLGATPPPTQPPAQPGPARTPTNAGGAGSPGNPVLNTMDPGELFKLAQQQGKI